MTQAIALSTNMTEKHSSWYFALAAFYISTLCVMNLINITRIVHFNFSLGSHLLAFSLPIGILPYPLTFLCMDVVTECFGKKAAERLVSAGLIANIWMLCLMWGLGYIQAPATLPVSELHPDYTFYTIRFLTMIAIISSMLAYVVAQYLDVWIFHFLKNLTKGKHLWLRNNVSTLLSQFVDTVIVLGCTFWMAKNQLSANLDFTEHSAFNMMTTSYLFKSCMALLDTLPCYALVWFIKRRQASSF